MMKKILKNSKITEKEYYSINNISRNQYDAVKHTIINACENARITANWGCKWSSQTKSWKINTREYCPLSAVILKNSKIKIAPPSPYDNLDSDDYYNSYKFATISKLLSVPEDFIFGFLYGFDYGTASTKLTCSKHLSLEQKFLPSNFPINFIRNKMNAKRGMTMGRWFRKHYLHKERVEV